MINPIYIQTFLAVVEAGNYTAAAEQLHMSQPAVSQHIRALEDQLGDVRLFRRNGQRMIPTHAGEELLSAARELVALVERTEQSIRALRGQTVGQVRLGCVPGGSEDLLPPLLTALHAQHPGIQISVRVGTSEVLLAALARQELDLLWLDEQQRRRIYEAHLLGNEEVCLVAAQQHPLLEQAEVPVGMLREVPLILPLPDTPLRRTLEEWLRKRGIPLSELQVVFECSSMATVLGCVAQGNGVAFLAARHASPATQIGVVALAGLAVQQGWWLVRERQAVLSRAAEETFGFLRSSAAQQILRERGVQVAE